MKHFELFVVILGVHFISYYNELKNVQALPTARHHLVQLSHPFTSNRTSSWFSPPHLLNASHNLGNGDSAVDRYGNIWGSDPNNLEEEAKHNHKGVYRAKLDLSKMSRAPVKIPKDFFNHFEIVYREFNNTKNFRTLSDDTDDDEDMGQGQPCDCHKRSGCNCDKENRKRVKEVQRDETDEYFFVDDDDDDDDDNDEKEEYNEEDGNMDDYRYRNEDEYNAEGEEDEDDDDEDEDEDEDYEDTDKTSYRKDDKIDKRFDDLDADEDDDQPWYKRQRYLKSGIPRQIFNQLRSNK